MIGVLNSDNATLAKYKDAAKQVDMAESPASAFGGTFSASSDSNGTVPSNSTDTGTSTVASPTADRTLGPINPTNLNAAGRVTLGGGGGDNGAWGAAFTALSLGGLAFAAFLA